MELNIGISNAPKSAVDFYIGVNNAPRRVLKAYIGVNNVPRLFYDGNKIYAWRRYTIAETVQYQWTRGYQRPIYNTSGSFTTATGAEENAQTGIVTFSGIGSHSIAQTGSYYCTQISYTQTAGLYSISSTECSATATDLYYQILIAQSGWMTARNVYTWTRSEETIQSKGTFIDFVISENSDTYPEDGVQDGYWYTRAEPISVSFSNPDGGSLEVIYEDFTGQQSDPIPQYISRKNYSCKPGTLFEIYGANLKGATVDNQYIDSVDASDLSNRMKVQITLPESGSVTIEADAQSEGSGGSG